jgi:hypothetical protein
MPAAASERVSRLLHTVVFRMPSPSNISSSGDALAEANLTAADVAAAAAEAESMGIAAIAIPDLGASRALAAGFGPLSFVGSGYGVMLVLTVS